jgi:S1-C subfamily serine protease
MRPLALLALVALTFSGCTIPPVVFQNPTELKKLPLYQEADYLALIRVEYIPEAGDHLYTELSGFLVSHNGKYYVITAGHIQKDDLRIERIWVRFKNDPMQDYEAVLLGYHRLCDTAVLKMRNPNFRFEGKTAKLGNSQTVRLYDKVYSLGNPNRFYWYISEGEVKDPSYRARYAQVNCDTIVHFAIGGPGSSGGPLLNTEGEVIGMNVAFRLKNPLSEFSNDMIAIPINEVKKAFENLIAD